MEFFAELSVALLSPPEDDHASAAHGGEYNKWFPYNRGLLMAHDPNSFAELRRLWRESSRALEKGR